MTTEKYKQVACYITPEQHDLLKQLSDETLVPMQAILRQAVNMILAKYLKMPKTFDKEYFDSRMMGLKKGATR